MSLTLHQQRKLILEYPTANEDRQEEIFLAIINQYAALINKHTLRNKDRKQAVYEKLHTIMLNPKPDIPVIVQIRANIRYAAKYEQYKQVIKHHRHRAPFDLINWLLKIDIEEDESYLDNELPDVSEVLMDFFKGNTLGELAKKYNSTDYRVRKLILKELNDLRVKNGKEPRNTLTGSKALTSSKNMIMYSKLWNQKYPNAAHEYYLKAKAAGKIKQYVKNREKKVKQMEQERNNL
jgi:hypothetical protein